MNLKTLLVISAIIIVPWLGVKDYYTRGEPREALVIQQMVETGNYILPEVYNGAVPSKPPLFHWIGVGVSKVTGGVTEFATRLPSALAALTFLCLFGVFLQSRIRSPWLPGLVLISSFEWFRACITTRVDMLLACCMGGALLTLFRWIESRRIIYLVASSALLSGAFLTKGPVGLVLPLGIFFLFWIYEERLLFRPILTCIALALCSAILPLIWYYWAYRVGGDRFLDKILYENVARFTSTMEDEPHSGSVLYLLGTLIVGLLPWLLVVLAGWRVRDTVRSIREKFLNDKFFRFSIFVICGVFTFYAVPDSKRSTYLLPLYPFVAYIFSVKIAELGESNSRVISIASRICISVFFAILLVCIGIAAPWGSLDVFPPFKNYLRDYPIHFASGLAVVIALGYQAIRGKHGRLESLGISLLSLLLLIQVYIAPSVANSLSYRPFSEQIRPIVAANSRIFSFGDEFYGISFYLDKDFYILSDKEQIKNGDVVVLYESNLSKLSEKLSGRFNITELSRSTSDVVKKGKKCLLVGVADKNG